VQRKNQKRDKWVLLIGIVKVIKAVLLIALGLGAMRLLQGDIAGEIEQWARRINLDARNPFFETFPAKIEALTPRKISMLSAGAFVYAALFLAEGIGLLLRKRWGEYLTIIITASFLPFEIYEMIAKEFSAFKLGLLIANTAVVIYLVWHLRQGKKTA